jgi:hypothetical protein
MSSPSEKPDFDPGSWALSFSRRLRNWQSSRADEPPEVREKFLSDELERELRQLSGVHRKDYLDALSEYFPGYEITESKNVQTQEKTALLFDRLLDQLLELTPVLTAEQKENLVSRLHKASLFSGTSLQPIERTELAAALGNLNLPADLTLDVKRLGHLFTTLSNITIALDRLAWDVWKKVAPMSSVKRDSMQPELQGLMARAISNTQAAPVRQAQEQLERTRSLIAGMITSMETIGQDFANYYHDNFSPAAIKEYLKQSNGGISGIFANPDSRAWACYTDRAYQLVPSAIEKEIKKQLSRSTEKLILGENKGSLV